MSQLGAPFTPPPPYDPPPIPPPSRPSSSEIPSWIVLLAAAVALCLAGLLGFVVVHGRSDGTSAPPPPPKHHYPSQWDKRIKSEVRIAEKQRGLSFKHPVAVRFLAPAAFRKTLVREDKLTAKDRRQIRQQTGLLRAFGLLSGKVDLVRAEQDFSGTAVLAYYSFKTRSITIRGHHITPSIRATLVHELTHALQDQYFHVGALFKTLAKQKHSKNDEQSVLHAITEGDAQRTEHAYGSSLGTKQRQALIAAQRREAGQARQGLARIPKIIIAFESSPYDLGEGLVRTVAQHGGNAAVARLFRHPPAYDIALVDPFRVIQGHTGAVRVPAPTLGKREKKFDSGDFGALSWYLMLSARLPALQALHTVDGWGGDSFVGYQSAGRSCARMTYRGRTPADTSAMYSSLQQWIAAVPGSPASVRLSGGVLTFQSCDPGVGGATVSTDFQPAVDLVTTRTLVGATLLHSGASVPQARCLAGKLVDTYTVAQLNDPTFGANDPSVATRMQQLGAECQ
ncbi:hypothetical protein [Nocardioides sp.]|jgi:hypothetical protein|uniref:hypothetical protein n=1 Tax=Nocardioides sp. TaxID=35761 RepID=UPI002F3F0B70